VPEKTLYRSTSNRMISGICGGLAEYFDVDTSVLRIAMVAFTVITLPVFGPFVFLAYLVCIFIIPRNPVPASAAAAGAPPGSGQADRAVRKVQADLATQGDEAVRKVLADQVDQEKQVDQADQTEQANQVDQADQAGQTEQADQAGQTEQADQAGQTEQADQAKQAGKGYRNTTQNNSMVWGILLILLAVMVLTYSYTPEFGRFSFILPMVPIVAIGAAVFILIVFRGQIMEVFRHRRLYRLREGKKIFGVCNGLADAFDLDPTLVRIGFFIAFLFSVGTVTLIYLFMAFVMPEGRPERPAQDD